MGLADNRRTASFRDPDGFLEEGEDNHMIRRLTPRGQQALAHIQNSATIRGFQTRQSWITAQEVPGDPSQILHPRIFFPSHPHEWPASMLHRAAQLTLEVNAALLAEHLELKDATPTNILFEGTRPVFVDHLSPKARDPLSLGWGAYGQFSRTFLIPLFLHQRRGVPLSWMFIPHRDGVPPERALPIMSLRDRISGLGLRLVVLPHLLAKQSAGASAVPRGSSSDLAQAVNRRMLSALGRSLSRLKPTPPKTSQWSDYQDLGTSYSPQGLSAKDQAIGSLLNEHRPAAVLDLGCNTGRFSKLAAQAGARVVAMDSDPACVERLFLEAERESLDLQPLVMDLGRPSPRLGWNGSEERSLVDRLAGRFDMVLALALVHHLLVRERIPLESVIDFIAAATTRWAIVEWVEREDPQFQVLAGPNAELYQDCTASRFEEAASHRFRLIRTIRIPDSTRCLYLLEKS